MSEANEKLRIMLRQEFDVKTNGRYHVEETVTVNRHGVWRYQQWLEDKTIELTRELPPKSSTRLIDLLETAYREKRTLVHEFKDGSGFEIMFNSNGCLTLANKDIGYSLIDNEQLFDWEWYLKPKVESER